MNDVSAKPKEGDKIPPKSLAQHVKEQKEWRNARKKGIV